MMRKIERNLSATLCTKRSERKLSIVPWNSEQTQVLSQGSFDAFER